VEITDRIPAEALQEGAVFEFGPVSLTEDEIIEFGRVADPQPIHTDPAAARQSYFGGLIASGLHPYVKFHKEFWAPMVQEHFIAGLGFDQVRFKQPVRPGMPMKAAFNVLQVAPKPDRGTQAVHWRVDVYDQDGKIICWVEFSTYHYLADRFAEASGPTPS
jgi:acyl dehydratase